MQEETTDILNSIPQLEKELPAESFGTADPWWVWVGIGAILIGLTVLYLRQRKKKETQAVPPSPVEQALTSLSELEKMQCSLRECALRLSLILRVFLRGALEDPALFETHEEFSQRLDSLSGVPHGQREAVRRLLERFAELKYGNARAHPQEHTAEFIADTRKLIEDIDAEQKRNAAARASGSAVCFLSAVVQPAHEFTWGMPEVLWLLVGVVLLLLLRRRVGAAGGVLHPTLRFLSAGARPPRFLAGHVGPICAAAAAACLILALAQPRLRNEYDEQKVSGIDIMIACDLSGSMSLRDMSFTVQDTWGRTARTTVDRLTAAKHVISGFIAGRPNDRIGLLAFAGRAKLCSPLTLDHAIINYILEQFYLATPGGFGETARAGYIEPDGTAIGTAIAGAATRLEERRETKSRIIILVTDGVNNAGSISPQDAAQQAAKLGIRIFTIAIGRDERLSRYTAEVDTFDEKTLRSIADITGGKFYRASSGAQFKKAFESIDRLERTDATRRRLVSYKALFIYPLLVGAVLLVLGLGCELLKPRPAP